jgi:uncharacterized FlaG/YvyC family protein
MEEVVMRNDDSIKVPTWRPDTAPTSPVPHAARKQAAKPEDPVPDDKRAVPVNQTVKAAPNPGRREQISLDELAENLRRMNMTFDLFEIQAKFSIDKETHEIKIVVRNTKTGEVIRRIPPTDFNVLYDQFINGMGTTFNGIM